MKKTLLTLGLAALCFTGFAQGNLSEKGIITLNVSSAIPTGDFGNNKVDDDKAGLAKSGGYLALEYTKFFNDYIGGGITLASRTNAYDVDKIAEYFTNAGIGSGTVTATSWSSIFYMGNLVVKYPVTEKFTVYGKGSIGTSFNTSPEFEITIGNDKVSQSKAKSSALAYGIGGGARYSFGRFALGLEVYSLNTKPEFQVDQDKMEQSMNTLNTGLTFGYILK